MLLNNELFEKKFGDNFQKNIKIVLNKKVVREGKLILFAPKDFYMVLTIETNKKHKTFEIPVPFSYSFYKEKFIFNYELESLTDDISIKIKSFNYHQKTKSKFFNNKLEILFS